jgi:hypothetical protein
MERVSDMWVGNEGYMRAELFNIVFVVSNKYLRVLSLLIQRGRNDALDDGIIYLSLLACLLLD